MDYRNKNISQKELNWFDSRTEDKSAFIIVEPNKIVNIGRNN